nr:MAG TPA: hypothetical protein [Caudoviricetes sp.]
MLGVSKDISSILKSILEASKKPLNRILNR